MLFLVISSIPRDNFPRSMLPRGSLSPGGRVKIKAGKKMLDSSTTFHSPLHSSQLTALRPRKRRRPREEKNKSLVVLAASIPSPSPLLLPSPSPSPSPSPCKPQEHHKLLGIEFFQCDALQLAPKLLGKLLGKDDVILQITEVEAYRQNDTACHGRFGITARTAPVFGLGGHSYVYLCYGIHSMLNVVADKAGVGAAVLIRSCAPICGLEIVQSRRGQLTNKPVLLTGPGKVGQALGLTTDWSNHPLYTPGGLELLDGPAVENIVVGPRVGIGYAARKDVEALWRFAIAGSAWISAPRNTLRPASPRPTSE